MPSWRESNFGEWEGKTYEDVEKDMDYRTWIDDPYEYAPPGGESLVEVRKACTGSTEADYRRGRLS